MSSALQSVRGFFTLERERSLAEALARPSRDRALTLARLARQKREAADVVRRAGQLGEAVALVREAVVLALEAATVARLAVDELVDRGAVDEALARAEQPVLDAEADRSHRQLFRSLAEAYGALEEPLAPFRLDARARRRLSVLRTTLVVLGVAGAIGGGIVRARRTPKVDVAASASFSKKFGPENAIDRDNATEWLLPDHSAGWIEIAPRRPRPVRALKILNGSNRPGPDRAIVDYMIEVWQNGQLSRAFEGTFGAFNPSPEWKVLSLGVEGPVERVRITVKTWAGQGAGVAELGFVY